ncbi:lipoprotein-attachment site-containing protein [Marinobacter gudaonensis]|uniref:Lipoprotein-attachment site-containing protein n=2 Tax=Marinobacter gudaonensis TaxID=375760 RepID=A0A1I6H836_9GAMM|nr:lipoprotein [Marinobacter gudaonensis]SFR50673.1 lipoprotein-attachment site-containing protein [Marinobacter gudaonensis]
MSTLPIALLVLAVLLSGCGQKGPLYRESPGVEAPTRAETVDDRQQDDGANARD